MLSNTKKTFPRFISFSVLFSMVFLFIAFSLCARLEFDRREEKRSHDVTGRGIVLLERAWGGRRAVVVGGMGGEKYLMKLPAISTFREGDIAKFSGKAKPLEYDFQEGFNEGLYWKVRGVKKILVPENVELDGVSRFSLARWRRTLKERILLSLPPLTRGYLLAAWLGERDPELQKAHSRWGTSHILAISGFHVGLVVLLVSFFIKKNIWMQSFLLWLYVLASGAQVSAIRAAVMFQIFLLARVVGRPPKLLNTVCVASIILLLIKPLWFWDLGFRLSVLSVLTLSVLGINKNSWRKLAALPAIWFTTGAVVSRAFGEVPLVGIIINMFAIPFFSVLLPVGSFLAILPTVFSGTANWSYIVVLPVEFVLALWHNLADMMVSLLPIKIGVSFFPFPIVVLMIMYSVYKNVWGNWLLSVLLAACAAIFVVFLGVVLP